MEYSRAKAERVTRRLACSALRSRHELGAVLARNLDHPWSDPVKSKEVSLTDSVEISDQAIPDGCEGSGGWAAKGRR